MRRLLLKLLARCSRVEELISIRIDNEQPCRQALLLSRGLVSVPLSMAKTCVPSLMSQPPVFQSRSSQQRLARCNSWQQRDVATF